MRTFRLFFSTSFKVLNLTQCFSSALFQEWWVLVEEFSCRHCCILIETGTNNFYRCKFVYDELISRTIRSVQNSIPQFQLANWAGVNVESVALGGFIGNYLGIGTVQTNHRSSLYGGCSLCQPVTG
jgi:hypothetical protein